MRIVLDTNVLISAYFFGGLPRLVYTAGLEGRYRILRSEALIAELRRVLGYEKLRNQLARTSHTIDSLVDAFSGLSEHVAVAAVPDGAVRDKKDTPVLACALGGNADYIVTGDRDLLTLGYYEHVQIVAPARFLEILYATQSPP